MNPLPSLATFAALAILSQICSAAFAATPAVIEPPMVAIPAGSFMMGSATSTRDKPSPKELPVHAVRIAAFRLAAYEVTVGQFRQFIEATGYKPADTCWKLAATEWGMDSGPGSWNTPAYAPSEQHPVMCVSWLDAHAYAAWLSAQSGKTYRLPSEAEWEYAARAGSTSLFHFGDDEGQACRYGNVLDTQGRAASMKITGKTLREAACDDGAAFTSIVGMYQPNAFGLYDMIGNVSEYVEDCEHANYEGAPTDGSAWTSACSQPMKARRGGSYSSRDDARSAARAHAGEDNASSIGEGFRLALSGAGPVAPSPATVRFEAALKAARAKAGAGPAH